VTGAPDHMDGALDGITIVIMAKRPEPGRVKLRLVRARFVDEAGAAAIAGAMLECTIARLRRAGDVVLALTPGAEPLDAASGAASGAGLRTIDQGEGDLGSRIDRVWRVVGTGRPAAFFGGDSPDVPISAIASIRPALAEAMLAVGPTDDGGYWTLAARSYVPAVLRGIDWGGRSVYDQTRRRAAEAGASFRVLPSWHDVDRPEDVHRLRRRLTATRADEPTDALDRLAARLDDLLEGRGPTQ